MKKSSSPCPATSQWGLGGFSWVSVCPHSHLFTRLSEFWPTSLQGPLPSVMCKIWHLFWSNFISFLLCHSSRLSQSLWLAALHLSILPDPPSLGSSENLVRAHFSIGQDTFQNRHVDTPFTSGNQVQPENMTLWASSSNQASASPSRPY